MTGTPAPVGDPGRPSSSGTHAIGSAARAQVRDTFSTEMPAAELWVEPAARAGELQHELSVAREQLAQLLLERDRLEKRVVSAKGQVALLEGIVADLAAASAVESKDDRAPSLPDTVRIRALPLIQQATADVPSERRLEPALAGVTVRTVPFAVQVAEDESRSRHQLRLVGRADSPERADQSTRAGYPMEGGLRARGCEVDAEFLGDTYLFSGLGNDVAGSGVFVATYQDLALGAAVELELELPSGPVRALGEVRWSRGESEDADQRPGLGIVFMGLSSEAKAALADVLRSHATRYHEV